MFVQLFTFQDDRSREGRVISSVKIGDVYMSRVIMDPGYHIGHYYHKETSIMFYVESGSILTRFEQVETKEWKEIALTTDRHAVHVPPFIALSVKNVGFDQAVVVVFSNHKLNTGDEFEYHVSAPVRA